MRRISRTNRNTMLFYYRKNPLVDLKQASTCAPTHACTHHDDHVLYAQAYERPSTLTKYQYVEIRPYCPICTHDTYKAPYCGGMSCATIQRELDVEYEWTHAQETSDTSDCDGFPTEDSEIDWCYTFKVPCEINLDCQFRHWAYLGVLSHINLNEERILFRPPPRWNDLADSRMVLIVQYCYRRDISYLSFICQQEMI